MALLDSFVTSQKADYKWPYVKETIFRPSAPPITTPKFYMERPYPGHCHCDSHLYDPLTKQYQQIGLKEKELCDQLYLTRQKLTQLANQILDHPCDTNDKKMETIYKIDYGRRGEKIVDYRAIRAAIDAPEGIPVKKQTITLEEGYRDPRSFRYQAFVRPTIGSDGPISFITTPNTIEAWFRNITPRSEYQDTVNKTGIAVLRNLQQFKEPQPSSRRRIGDGCL